MVKLSRRFRRMIPTNKDYTWAEILGAGAAIIGIVVVAFAIGAVLMIIPAWIGHWILVNLFNYTALSLWQVWGILIGLRLAFGGLITINKN
jgi:hypothetical protein